VRSTVSPPPLRTTPFAVSANVTGYFDASLRATPQGLASQRGNAQVGCNDAKFNDGFGSQLATAVAFNTTTASRPGAGFRLSSVNLLLKVCTGCGLARTKSALLYRTIVAHTPLPHSQRHLR
jgi:hypothetical protein